MAAFIECTSVFPLRQSFIGIPVNAHVSPIYTKYGGPCFSRVKMHSKEHLITAKLETNPSTLPKEPVTTMDAFWKLADESKVASQYEANENIEFLEHASLDEIRSICLQYRYFIERYPDHLSVLLSKMPNQQLKSLLSTILAEELGSGKISDAHIMWYDRFLVSIGIPEEELCDDYIYDENEGILSEIACRCKTLSFEHGVGLVGMGGECLCQIYLTAMYKNLRKNPNLHPLGDQIDWEFWHYHVGEADIEHRRLVRECINELVIGEEGIADVADGYTFGKNIWDMFWDNNYKFTSVNVK